MPKLGTKENQNYISLQKATKYCPYSQDYLSLRARQRKLKSIKIGRNWVTTKEWIEEYLEKAKEYNNNKNSRVIKTVVPPENLPITEKILSDIVIPESNKVLPLSKIRLGFTFALIFILLTTGITFGKDSIKNVFEDINPYVTTMNQRVDVRVVSSWQWAQEGVQKLGQTIDKGIIRGWTGINKMTKTIGQVGDSLLRGTAKSFEESFGIVSKDVSYLTKITVSALGKIVESSLAGVNQVAGIGQEASGSVSEAIKGIGQGITEGIKGIGQGITKGIKDIGQGVKNIVLSLIKDISRLVAKPKEEIPEEPIVPKPAREGLAVIPSTEKDEEVKKKIKESFSDEVKVEPKDEISGIIIPIFREREGEKYLYILVPLRY